MSTLEILVTGAQATSGLPPPTLATPWAAEGLASERLGQLFEIRVSARSGAIADRIQSTLSDLPDGWCGSDSVAPSESVLTDLQNALSESWLSADPVVEVDTDGSVALVWTTSPAKSFTLTFVGNGQVVGSVFPQNESGLPWALPAEAKHEIAARLAEREVARPLL